MLGAINADDVMIVIAVVADISVFGALAVSARHSEFAPWVLPRKKANRNNATLFVCWVIVWAAGVEAGSKVCSSHV